MPSPARDPDALVIALAAGAAAFADASPDSLPGDMGDRIVTGVDFVSLPSRDVDAAVAFYGEVLGLECLTRYSRSPGAEFQAGQLTLQILDSEAHGLDFQPNTHPVALHVEDMADARGKLEARGVRFSADTLDTGVCHIAVFRDPDGNRLMLHHRYQPR